MQKIIIIGMCILLLLITGATYKLNLFMFLHEYKEECYEHEWYDYVDCVGYWSYDNYTNVSGSWELVKLDKPICKCGDVYFTDGCLRTISLPNESKCLKYHLVRNV